MVSSPVFFHLPSLSVQMVKNNCLKAESPMIQIVATSLCPTNRLYPKSLSLKFVDLVTSSQ